MSLTSIIILTLNNLEKTKKCLESIRQYTSSPYELIIVDNGSSDGTVSYLKNMQNIQLICNSENRGFSHGCNQGLFFAKGEQILLLNNDTIVSHRWLENLLMALHSHPTIGLVGPLSNMTLSHQHFPYTYTNDINYHQFAFNFNQHNPAKWKQVSVLSGFCLLFKREVLSKIGLLDERYTIGNYEDIDYCYRALKEGYMLLVAGDTFIYHEGNSSFKKNNLDIQRISDENEVKFQKKWGVNPIDLVNGKIEVWSLPPGGKAKSNTKKRIMFFSHLCQPNRMTGSEKNLIFMINHLRDRFHCILVVPNEGYLSLKAREQGIETVVLPFPLAWTLINPSANTIAEIKAFSVHPSLQSLIQLFSNHKPQMILTNTSVNLIPAIAAKSMGIPVVWWIHEVIPQNPFTHDSTQAIESHSDLIIAVSHAVLKPFMLQPNHNSKRKVLLYASWIMESLQPEQWSQKRNILRKELGLTESQKIVGTLSAEINREKGLEHFIRMALSLCKKRSDVHFLIAGHVASYSYSYYNNCLTLIKHSGYADRFHIIPFQEDISKFYTALDVVVIPSVIDEGFGMTALEGLIFGKPVVAYKSGGLEEIINSTGQNRFLVQKGNWVELENQVLYLVSNDDLRMEIGKINQQTAMSHFGIQRYLASLEELIKEMNLAIKDRGEEISFNKKLPNGILIQGTSHPIYLLENGAKRHIVDESTFYFYKFKWESVVKITDHQLKIYPTANPININRPLTENAPKTLLIRGTKNVIYLLNNGVKHAFASYDVFYRLKFNLNDVVTLSDQLVDLIPSGLSLTDCWINGNQLIDGRLFSFGDSHIYYSDQGSLRRIYSDREIALFKWNKTDVIQLNPNEIKRFKIGNPIGIY